MRGSSIKNCLTLLFLLYPDHLLQQDVFRVALEPFFQALDQDDIAPVALAEHSKEWGVQVFYDVERYPPRNDVPWNVVLEVLHETVRDHAQGRNRTDTDGC